MSKIEQLIYGVLVDDVPVYTTSITYYASIGVMYYDRTANLHTLPVYAPAILEHADE